jgi:hypothetical protein
MFEKYIDFYSLFSKFIRKSAKVKPENEPNVSTTSLGYYKFRALPLPARFKFRAQRTFPPRGPASNRACAERASHAVSVRLPSRLHVCSFAVSPRSFFSQFSVFFLYSRFLGIPRNFRGEFCFFEVCSVFWVCARESCDFWVARNLGGCIFQILIFNNLRNSVYDVLAVFLGILGSSGI